MSGGGKNGSSDVANQALSDEAARQQTIRDGTTNVNSIFDAQFTPDYFSKQATNYSNYATPQLTDQFGKASKELTYALDRSGLLNSSARATKSADLQQTYDLQKQKVADDALSFETQARNNVEDARTGLVQTLNATGDATGAANSALTRATALSQPVAYSPLTQMFSDFTNSLGTSAAAAKSYALGSSTTPSSTSGLFGTPAGAVVNR